MANPLLCDRNVRFLLDEVLGAGELCELPDFAEYTPETLGLVLSTARKLAREVLYPTFQATEAEPPTFRDGRVRVHPLMAELVPRIFDLELLQSAPTSGGPGLPRLISNLGAAYLMAGNQSVYSYAGLTIGVARLLTSFASEEVQQLFVEAMWSGKWAGTMALTEPQAGTSVGDLSSLATPSDDHFKLVGDKLFISGGDHDVVENIVHLVLARTPGAPPGPKGISLFAVPKRRPQGGTLVDNDVRTTGLIRKIGWKGLPSVSLSFGDKGDCRAWLVGERNAGLKYMFQMMNSARLLIGFHAMATASVAYHESVAYAKERLQGRTFKERAPATPQVPIVAHPDVRRLLLKQKAIVEGGLALLAAASRYLDLSHHAGSEAERTHAGRLADVLVPVAKAFCADRGQEANSEALQVHGGYGYTTEFPLEAWWRDQRLNSIHEGTSGVQGLDLLGRKIVKDGGAPLMALHQEIGSSIRAARDAELDEAWLSQLEAAVGDFGSLTAELGALGAKGDLEGMLGHSSDYMELASVIIVAWQWVDQARAALLGRKKEPDCPFYRGKLAAAQYWISTELSKAPRLSMLCRTREDSYSKMEPSWF